MTQITQMGTAEQRGMDAARGVLLRACLLAWHHRLTLYRNWCLDKLEAYLAFQFIAGCLFLEPDGFLVAWPDSLERLQGAEEGVESYFEWSLPLPAAEADCFVLADVVTEERARRFDLVTRHPVVRLVEQVSRRWPEWKTRRVFTFRRGRLHELSARAIARFSNGERT